MSNSEGKDQCQHLAQRPPPFKHPGDHCSEIDRRGASIKKFHPEKIVTLCRARPLTGADWRVTMEYRAEKEGHYIDQFTTSRLAVKVNDDWVATGDQDIPGMQVAVLRGANRGCDS